MRGKGGQLRIWLYRLTVVLLPIAFCAGCSTNGLTTLVDLGPGKSSACSRAIYQYELEPSGPQGDWNECRGRGLPLSCSQFLNLTKFVDGKETHDLPYGLTCCWSCANGKNACPGRFWPGKVLSKGQDTKGRCETARSDDFNDEGKCRLQRYLEWLARTYGGPVGLRPQDFELGISQATPPVRDGRTESGTIACAGGRLYIYIFQQALIDRTLAQTYNTIAHEFYHHFQVRRDNINCNLPAGLPPLEAQAYAWAQSVAPLCP